MPESNKNMKKFRIGIIGLGYIGLPLSIEFSKIYNVVGFDIDRSRIKDLKNGFDITKSVSKNKILKLKNLTFSFNSNDLINCNVYIITVPTPISSTNRPDLTYLKSATSLVGKLLKKNDIVIFESTVYPGLTEEICVPILTKESGLQYIKEFSCGYSPERLNPGDKKNKLKSITKIISSNSKNGLKIMKILYGSILKSKLHIAPNIKVAEAAKVIENCQRDINIAFVNELSIIFKRLNIDTMDVLKAAKTKWNFIPFNPGMVGGHCIGVDPYYLTYKAEEVGYIPQMILSGRRINESMAKFAARNLIQLMVQNNIRLHSSKVAILGITYKENCPDIRNSKVITLINELKSWKVKVQVVDEIADQTSLKKLNIKLSSFKQLSNLNAIIVAVGHNEFRALKPRDLIKLCKKDTLPVIGDLKSLYDKKKCEQVGFTVFRL